MMSFTAVLVAAMQIGQPARDPLAQRAVAELRALQPDVTPTAWLTTHADDQFLIFRREAVRENHESWCARASKADQLADGVHVVRYAYFYPPRPSSSLALPDAAGPTLIRQLCTLGTIWIDAGPADSAAGNALATSVRATLTQAYGPVAAEPDVFFGRVPTDSQRKLMSRLPGAAALLLGLHYFGAAAWRTPGGWQVDSTVVVSAFDRGFERGRADGRVLAFAYLPIAKLGSFRDVVDRGETAERNTAVLVAQAARLSGLSGARTNGMIAMLATADSAYHERGRISPRIVDSTSVEVIRDWTANARTLGAARQAAALLAADQVLGSSPMMFVRAQRRDTSRVAYEGLGAVFVRDELGGGYNYTHNWLDEALRLDPLGPVGRLARLALLRIGFNETGMCGGGSEAFRRVITTGEQLLGGNVDTITAAEVHRLVGDAYADIVALAAGAVSDYADSAPYLAQAPTARSRAIAHYRQALALDHGSEEARVAWLEAWRLIAGLPPTTTHFFCVYD